MITNTAKTALCGWCGRRFNKPPWGSGESQDYCCRQHQRWAIRVAAEDFPVTDCPRCQCRDLKIAAPDWAICQTCGYQTDRPDLTAGQVTPRNFYSSIGVIKRLLEDKPTIPVKTG